MKFLLVYIRLPYPPLWTHPIGTQQITDQKLEITVEADNQQDAVAKGQSLIDHQIRGITGPNPTYITPKVRGGSPRLYALDKVIPLYRTRK